VSEATQTQSFLRILGWALGVSLGLLASASPVAAAAQETVTVDSNADSAKLPGSGISCRSQAPGNPCTLRAAIETANGFLPAGSTINVPGAYSGTQAIKLTLGQLDLSRSQTIVRAGAPGSATVDAQNASRVFRIEAGVTVTMFGLTVRHGSVAGDGGGINDHGTLTLNDVTVTDNQAVGGLGGGIYAAGPVTMNRGLVTHNGASATPASPGGGFGGAAYVDDGGSLSAAGTSFTDSTASDQGGGIRVRGTATLDRVTISGNVAVAGGGIALCDPGVLQVRNSTISRNTSMEAAGGGGGILDDAATTELSLVNSTLAGNVARLSAGGALLVLGSAATLSNDTFADNTADVGGAIAQGQVSSASDGAKSSADQILLADAGKIHARSATEHPADKDDRDRADKEKADRERAHKEKVKTAPTGPPRPDAVSLESSTVSGNLAVFAGGIFNQDGRLLTVHDSIVAGNAGPAGVSNCSSRVTSRGYNLEDAADCDFTATGDLRNAKARLGALSDNGGPTQTMAVGAGSPAIATGDPACLAPTVDQRGVSRPQGARCDIGAFEAVTTTPAAVATAAGLPGPPATGRAPMLSDPATHALPPAALGMLAGLATILALALGVLRSRRQNR
jgi:hypothetical protein